jgi:hypothetical protein
MTDVSRPYTTIRDFITGKTIPEIGAEANRQQVERLLVEIKGFSKEDIEVDVPIHIDINGEPYQSVVDLVVSVNQIRVMAIKCAAASLGSREREILSASRLLDRASDSHVHRFRRENSPCSGYGLRKKDGGRIKRHSDQKRHRKPHGRNGVIASA